MQRTLANAHQCPACGSIDVTIQCYGMPLPTFGHYMAAYEALSRAITAAALRSSSGDQFDVAPLDGEEFDEWFNLEFGQGLYAPGNYYNHTGCTMITDLDADGPCTCRSCGFQFDDWPNEDDDVDDEDADGEVSDDA
jgi:hypothetical protein